MIPLEALWGGEWINMMFGHVRWGGWTVAYRRKARVK